MTTAIVSNFAAVPVVPIVPKKRDSRDGNEVVDALVADNKKKT